MGKLIEQERETYERRELPSYATHSPGERYADIFTEFAKPGLRPRRRVRRGRGALALQARGSG